MLPKAERLTKEKEIKAVLRKREFQGGSPLLYLIAAKGQSEKPRLTVIAKKSLGKAVVRNRIRRLIIEAYRKIKHKIAKNYDIVVFPKPQIVGKRLEAVVLSLEKALAEAELT